MVNTRPRSKRSSSNHSMVSADSKHTPLFIMVNTRPRTKRNGLKLCSSSHFMVSQPTPLLKTVNTRPRTKRNRLKLCSSNRSMPDSDPDPDHHQSSMSADLVASNEDILIQILGRLPIRSVIRFKSVSKDWRSLLSHRRFTFLYDHVSLTPGMFVRELYVPFGDENRIRTRPFRGHDFYPDPRGIRIVQSCNGLLLCCSNGGNKHARNYYVFNPTTNQYAIIPSVCGGRDVRKAIRFMGLAFHQTDCPHYKLLCIHGAKHVHDEIEEVFQIQIYSSETGKWKISDESFSAPYHTSFDLGVYFNQAIYWSRSCDDPWYFKVDVEELQKLPLPEQVTSYQEGEELRYYLGECRGHLHLVMNSISMEMYLQLNVYEMLSDGSGWFVKYHVELDELPDAYPEMIHHWSDGYELEVIDVVRGEEETFLVLRIYWKIIRYNLKDKSFKQIFNLKSIIPLCTGHVDIHRYIQTLASVTHR